MESLSGLPVQIEVAIIASITTLLVAFLKDYILKKIMQKGEQKETAKEIYRKYADPLSSATTSLLWRLHEIFYVKHRGAFLLAKNAKTTFENYKQISTLYRLATVLGWIRALRRELSFLIVEKKEHHEVLRHAIRDLEGSLADGPHVEIERISALSNLWQLNTMEKEQELPTLATRVNNITKKALRKEGVDMGTELSRENKIKLCEDISEEMCNFLESNLLDRLILEETLERAIRCISIKETWLYRDWQTGLGDLMIREVESAGRRFEVIGYREFERMCENGTDDEKKWISRLRGIFENVDITGKNKYDARPKQLCNLLLSIAKLIEALAIIDKDRRTITEQTVNLAEKIQKDPPKL